ncbi:glycosyltransferase family 4 protein [Roseovarius sp. 10]|jgi:glycosyltransferase involved in cell wall biosynthesis|uniref:glycosyltransferase family 4 protein n=1 Tax=Roseovarius sp. 10 TaxID=3080563 RepID=UPI002955BB40|nr:glycosyltransferase family 4 protein [Roseovarius sp. 10]MDV7200674.1 glycosyltransferase family 4 protein [Roseovarius sp. 10]
MSNFERRSVVFFTLVLTHYRVAFHRALRAHLAARGVCYDLVYSPATGPEAQKADVVDLEWARCQPAWSMPFVPALRYQSLWHWRKAGLVIVGQENRNLTAYAAILGARLFGYRVAYFGHGRNFQAKNPNSLAERWKRFWATKVDWWFTYTNGCADLIAGYGFPRAKITVFNNAIDLSQIAEERAALDPAKIIALRARLCHGSENVAVFVGGLYAQKRLSFLIHALDLLRWDIPDLQVLFIGAGPEAHIIQEAAETRDWLHALGPKFGAEKTLYVSLGKVWLMPGLVGLGVLDSFAYETPMVTTQLPYHSPEIDYLQDGVNGVIVRDSDNPQAYADAVHRVLSDLQYRDTLIQGARIARHKYSIEDMSRRFAEGVLRAMK